MKCTCAAIALTLVVGIASTAATGAEENTTGAVSTQRAEDEVLRQQEGTWNATVEVFKSADREGRIYKGVTTNTLGCGGRCLISEYKSELQGQSFDGHGIATYDAARQRYVESFTDGMSPGLSTTEYTYDTVERTFKGTLTISTASGEALRMNLTGDYKDPNRRVMTFSRTGSDGQEMLIMQCALVLVTQ